MSLSALELDVLRLCAIDDWASPVGECAWRELRRRWGYSVNDAPVRAHSTGSGCWTSRIG
jgi:hypothetical protein